MFSQRRGERKMSYIKTIDEEIKPRFLLPLYFRMSELDYNSTTAALQQLQAPST